MNSEGNYRIETLAVQAGYTPGNGDPRICPIVQSILKYFVSFFAAGSLILYYDNFHN